MNEDDFRFEPYGPDRWNKRYITDAYYRDRDHVVADHRDHKIQQSPNLVARRHELTDPGSWILDGTRTMFVRTNHHGRAFIRWDSTRAMWTWEVRDHEGMRFADGTSMELSVASMQAVNSHANQRFSREDELDDDEEEDTEEDPEESEEMNTMNTANDKNNDKNKNNDKDTGMLDSTKQLITDSAKLATGLVVAERVNDAASRLISAALVKLGVPAAMLDMPAVQTTLHLISPIVVMQLVHVVPELGKHASTIERGCTLAMSVEMTKLIGPLVGQLGEELKTLVSAAAAVDGAVSGVG